MEAKQKAMQGHGVSTKGYQLKGDGGGRDRQHKQQGWKESDDDGNVHLFFRRARFSGFNSLTTHQTEPKKDEIPVILSSPLPLSSATHTSAPPLSLLPHTKHNPPRLHPSLSSGHKQTVRKDNSFLMKRHTSKAYNNKSACGHHQRQRETRAGAREGYADQLGHRKASRKWNQKQRKTPMCQACLFNVNGPQTAGQQQKVDKEKTQGHMGIKKPSRE